MIGRTSGASRFSIDKFYDNMNGRPLDLPTLTYPENKIQNNS